MGADRREEGMSKSKIEWTDAVWNPVTGCSKVSDGCAHCYAEREWARLSVNPVTAYYGRKFNDILCHPERLDQPLKWAKPRKIFVNSMSDLFHEQVPDEFIARVWWVMGQCAGYLDPSRYRGHTFMILTKRPERMKDWLEGWRDQETRKRWIESNGGVFDWMSGPKYWPDVLPNVWLGVSVENQASADERIPLLLQTPAAVRFISAEPLLGPLDIRKWTLPLCKQCGGSMSVPLPNDDGGRPCPRCLDNQRYDPDMLNLVITGGESGPKARPMHPDWVRSLRDQCLAAGTKFFFKQWGEFKEICRYNSWPKYADAVAGVARSIGLDRSALLNSDGSDLVNGGPEHKVYPISHLARVGKKIAGSELDGRTWDEFPEVQ